MSTIPITIQKNFFYQGITHWSPKGTCYQPVDGVDPISDNNLAIIQKLLDKSNPVSWVNLGINAIRVYQVDPKANHDSVMAALSAAGIYVLVGAVNTEFNVSSTSADYHARLHTVADAFAAYDNVMGFSISNEAINPKEGKTPGYDIPNKVRTAAKDLRNYMSTRSYRKIPVGMALRDAPPWTIQAAMAYICGDAPDRVDFLGYNLERWGEGSEAGKVGAYYNFVKNFVTANPVPIVLTEYGVSTKTLNPRQYGQVPYLFGYRDLVPQSGPGQLNMADYVSGGFSFRYLERSFDPGWGIVQMNGSTWDGTGAKIPNAGFDNLAAAYAAITDFKGTAGTMTTLPEDPSNPYEGGTGGLPAALNCKFTFNVANSLVIALNVSPDASGDSWNTLAKGKNGDPTAAVIVPKGTQRVSMAYQSSKDKNWYGGCMIINPSSTLSEGCTIKGEWMSPDGQGACAVTS